MSDREKVIKAFDDAKELVWCEDDEYTVGYNNGIEAGKNIALSLLKEQEPLAVYEGKVNKCVCANEINRYWHPEYCGFCGKKLVWY